MKTNKFYLHYLLFITSAVLFSSYNHAHSLENAVNSLDRSSKNVSRDKYINPYETLSFFEIKTSTSILLSFAILVKDFCADKTLPEP